MTPEIIFLDPDNIRREIASPMVAGLCERGYTAGPAFLWQEQRDRDPVIAIVMNPPPPMAVDTASVEALRRVEGLLRYLVAVAVLAALLSAAAFVAAVVVPS